MGSVFYWYSKNTVPTEAGKEEVVVIPEGTRIVDIADTLEEKGLIKNSWAFRIYLRINNKKPNIQAGSFKLKSGRTIDELLADMAVGRVDKWVTIKEGLRKEEIAEILAKEFPVEVEEFNKLAKEGYIFPDTYLLPVDADSETSLDILTENFNKKVDENLKAKIAASGRSLEETIIIASLVEREAFSDSERPIIAGILIKRLNEGMRLEVDATTQYALGYQKGDNTWWKKNLTSEDLQVDSLYNTRRYAGLPPGPICNPGLKAIVATAGPEETDYYYYLHDNEGQAHFAKTLDEHNANVAKYLR